MADKVPTPGMPDKHSTAPRGDGTVDGMIPVDSRGAGGGGPTGPGAQSGGFHGGQSVVATYHDHGQLDKNRLEGDDKEKAVSADP
jgi:hypothetical protein